MTKGTLYGVGVGPGNKELLTLKAIKILKMADIIAVPDSLSGKSRAYDIIEDYIDGKEIIYCKMPMVKDKDILEKSHNESGEKIIKYLDMGKNVAFATLGDPSIYSTYMYIHRIVEKRGYKACMIPAVTSFCASAARLNISLSDGSEPLIIIPSNYKEKGNNKELLKINGNKVLMKNKKNIDIIKKEIDECGLIDKTYMVENCGMTNEKVHKDFSKVSGESSYFSLIIIKG